MRSSILLSNRGVTFIELIVSMLIAGVVMGAVSVTYISSIKHFGLNRERSQTQMRSRLSIDFLSQELRNAGYIVNWDTTPDAVSLAINVAIAGATLDANTESITLRYAVGPVSGAGLASATLTGDHNKGATTLTVNRLNLDGKLANGDEIVAGSLIAIYDPPTTVNVRRVVATNGVDTITLANALSSTFPVTTSIVAVVQETSFWIEGGNLMMRTAGTNQQLAANVEDLQVVLMTKNQGLIGDGDNTNNGTDDNGIALSDSPSGLLDAQMREVRAMRLSITGRSSLPLQDRLAIIPPNLEDHNRSGEPADQLLRQIQQTTIYLRNFGALDS